MTAARNIAIVLAIAAAIEFLPGGTDTAAIVWRTLSLAFIGVVAFGLAYLYRRHRTDLEALPAALRALGYAAVGALVLAFAGYSRMTATAGGGVEFAVIVGLAVLALVVVWRRYRALL
ncbi:MAG TPA: hypothetical protein VMT10_01800 [Solirubrobacteraceae bacterium]|nr:hypothetical protein [Solirubrobacteraceae bacterium]